MFFTEKEEKKNSENEVHINMQYIYEVQEHFITNTKDAKLLVKLHTNYNNDSVKNEILKIAQNEFLLRKVKHDEMEAYLNAFETYMWKYYKIEPLLESDEYTDIALYAYDHVTVRTVDNQRIVTDIRFEDEKDFDRFIRVTALKNEVQLSAVNALKVFVDTTSNDKYKLRIDISTEFVNCSGNKYMHIRKNPKEKYQTEDLVTMGVMSQEEMDYIVDRFNNGSGLLISGQGNSGKSTLFNALLDKLSHDKKALIVQESDGELFTDPNNGGHPDILFQKLVMAGAEGGVEYGLGDLVEKGLVSDFNLIGIGEIKDAKAAAKLLNASFTGHQVVTTCHGPDEFAAIEKLADYLHQGTGYSINECLKMLRTFETIIFMKNRKLGGISHIKGWDNEKKQLIIEPVTFHNANKYISIV